MKTTTRQPPAGDSLPPDLPRPRVRELLAAAFLRPHMLLLMPADRVRRALLVHVAAALLCGMAAAAVRIPSLLERSAGWARWMAGRIERVQLRDGRLAWESSQPLPWDGVHAGWRVDLVDAAQAPFDPRRRLGPEKRGVWIGPADVVLWWRLGERKAVVTRPLLENGLVFGFVKPEWLWPDGLDVRGERQMVAGVQAKVVSGLPVYLLSKSIETLVVAEFYTFLFAFIPFVMRSPLAGGGFRRVYSFYLYASVPPLLVATVYSSLGLPVLDFGTCFAGGLILYLLVTVWRLGRSSGGIPRPA
ncbi:MAG: hypothetical protein BWZ08_00163 [candidate division BRC1 bacterium ADurb.BinA292]|nr:MAG: hypothetical protein BWZ08_00163 [candidate division BRC1 bacterium ADurb.BinA292]